MKYILAIDQSTQGTKALLFDEKGAIVCREDRGHKQYISSGGWVSHDMEEIYRNMLDAVRAVVSKPGVEADEIGAVGISNQRETTVAWYEDGTPVCPAVVWQCARAKSITDELRAHAQDIRERTGIPLSPFFPAAKMTWILRNGLQNASIRLGTVDSYLIYRLTGGNFVTDFSNASRTQLLNLHTLEWDEELVHLFDIPAKALASVCDSDAFFGETDFEGILPRYVPILCVMGDSHGALFGQDCLSPGQTKATYGTGSSVMMNIGSHFIPSRFRLATSLAWRISGEATYVLEGNINYTGAVISWLKDDLRLIETVGELERLAREANPDDATFLVPAFSGLSAPHWNDAARALLCGMSRTTGRNEIAKAALESIAYQIDDVLRTLEMDSALPVSLLKADGGASRNAYLMQFQSDISHVEVVPALQEELSAAGVARLAGIRAGLYRQDENLAPSALTCYQPQMAETVRGKKRSGWRKAVQMSIGD